MKLVPNNINEAIKHLSGREVSDIQKNINTLVKNAGYNPKMKGKLINIINGELAINKNSLGKRPVEFLSNSLSLIKMFIRDNWQVDSSLDAEIIESLMYDLKNLIQKYDFSEIDESIKHLTGRSPEEIENFIKTVKEDIISLLKECPKAEEYLLDDEDTSKAFKKINVSLKTDDIRIITDADDLDYMHIFNFLASIPKIGISITKPKNFHDGYMDAFPNEKQIHYSGGMGVSAWFFDLNVMLKNIDEYIVKAKNNNWDYLD